MVEMYLRRDRKRVYYVTSGLPQVDAYFVTKEMVVLAEWVSGRKNWIALLSPSGNVYIGTCSVAFAKPGEDYRIEWTRVKSFHGIDSALAELQRVHHAHSA